MNNIDINFDYRLDSLCGDPDNDSNILYKHHKLLWSKNSPIKKALNLEILHVGGKYGRLILKNNLIDNLSSDRMCPHYVGRNKGKFDGWLSEEECLEFKHKVRTIGGHIVFPAHRKGGFTINQARGINRKISDRFDLTLECIKRFYVNETSPLYTTLLSYDDFFKLFIDFKSYVDFFLLQDFVDKNYNVLFTIPFDDFQRPSLPQSIEEYKSYKTEIITMINKRNSRILESLNK